MKKSESKEVIDEIMKNVSFINPDLIKSYVKLGMEGKTAVLMYIMSCMHSKRKLKFCTS